MEEIAIDIGINIEKWLNQYCNIPYKKESYIAEHPEYELYEFSKEYIIIRAKESIITSIEIYPYQFQSSPYYKGDIIVFDKKLEVPFLSNDVEKYFPEIKVKRPPSKVIDRFLPRETLDFPISETLKIEVSMGRSPELVGSISLKHL
ncbi:hypothetical protein KHA90_18580 [Flavobacterium psychroterrae]|uniref:Uncharacterized protein n=1 Tax=Flavobacterium psychroterrae TaxID=2133767 RepID=A0ABS5PFI0_9FLAO|nr:hypothetical protein [Flavobacterium psychroterrae]MBS7233032.1 hypothetical protein [Flavobacterium psychroterrae]